MADRKVFRGQVDLEGQTTIHNRKITNFASGANTSGGHLRKLTSDDCGTIIMGTVGATQASDTGLNFKLPTPAAGLYYHFICGAAALHDSNHSQFIITATSDGDSAANIAAGSVTVNNVTTNVTTAADVITFVKDKATTGDYAKCWCDGTNWHVEIVGDVAGAVTLA